MGKDEFVDEEPPFIDIFIDFRFVNLNLQKRTNESQNKHTDDERIFINKIQY